MRTTSSISRRAFIVDLGKGTLAVAVFGMTAMACGSDDPGPAATTAGGASGGASSLPPASETSSLPPSSETTSAATTSEATTAPVGDAAVSWERVNLGFVSAYVLARRGEATIVDTGVSGSEDAIAASLGVLDLGWDDVSHVIITHLHNDHQGSLPAVLNLAGNAAAYAGAADIPAISSPRELTAVGDGDTVFGLQIIETPGHTPGHICVLDTAGSGLLVAGDALNGANGGVIGANPDFTPDMVTADESTRKLAALTFDTVVFGHGEPVESGAAEQVAELAASI